MMTWSADAVPAPPCGLQTAPAARHYGDQRRPCYGRAHRTAVAAQSRPPFLAGFAPPPDPPPDPAQSALALQVAAAFPAGGAGPAYAANRAAPTTSPRPVPQRCGRWSCAPGASWNTG